MKNLVILIGNLGADPDVKFLPSGNAVATVNIATSRRWKDKNTGEKKEETEWTRVVFFNRTAEIAGEYLKKGSKVFVEGRLKTRKWTDKDGKDNYTTEVIASEMQMLGERMVSDKDKGYTPPATQSYGKTMPEPPIPDYADFDDEIPF